MPTDPTPTTEQMSELRAKATPGDWWLEPRFVGLDYPEAVPREVDCEIRGNAINGPNGKRIASVTVAKLCTGFVWYEGDKAFIAAASRYDWAAHAEAEQRQDERVRELEAIVTASNIEEARLNKVASGFIDMASEQDVQIRVLKEALASKAATLTAQADEIRRLRAAMEDVAETSPHEGTREFAKKTLAASGETK